MKKYITVVPIVTRAIGGVDFRVDVDISLGSVENYTISVNKETPSQMLSYDSHLTKMIFDEVTNLHILIEKPLNDHEIERVGQVIEEQTELAKKWFSSKFEDVQFDKTMYVIADIDGVENGKLYSTGNFFKGFFEYKRNEEDDETCRAIREIRENVKYKFCNRNEVVITASQNGNYFVSILDTKVVLITEQELREHFGDFHKIASSLANLDDLKDM